MSSTNTNTKPTTNTNTKEANDIRIGMGTRVRNVVRYCNSLLKEQKFKSLHFSAVGGAIGKLVSTVEVLKIVNEGLYQQNKFATVSYQSTENKEVKNQKLYPKMEVTLSLEDFKEKNEGYQKKLEEKERTDLYNIFIEQSTRRPRGRGGFRGRRGGFRGRRGGFRGRRGFRGGFRARGAGFRRGFRARGRGMRGNRGNNRGVNRGGNRGNNRPVNRGGNRGTK
jgi:hypothetical protein